MRQLLRSSAAILVACALLAGCASDDGGSRGGARRVVATTAVAADLATAVGGDRVQVTGLIPANADPHEYEPRPHDVRALSRAALVVRSGGDLDDWLGDALSNAGGDPRVVTLLDRVRRLGDDPHWWHDPTNAERAVAAIRDALIQIDPGGRQTYAANARSYLAALARLDADIAACAARIPPPRRKLVTSHDALGYYARRYGLEVIGTVIPSLSTQGQPSSGETAALVRTVRAAGVPVVFAESSVNPKVEQAIANEAGAKVGAPLYADGLGPEGSAGSTYVGAMRANTVHIVEGLAGDAAGCRLPE